MESHILKKLLFFDFITPSDYHQIFYDQFLGADIGRVVNDVSTDLAAGMVTPVEATKQVQEAWEFNQ